MIVKEGAQQRDIVGYDARYSGHGCMGAAAHFGLSSVDVKARPGRRAR